MAYQKILQLSYIDKFLSDIQMEFRNKYKDELDRGVLAGLGNFSDFNERFHQILYDVEQSSRQEAKAPKLVALSLGPYLIGN